MTSTKQGQEVDLPNTEPEVVLLGHSTNLTQESLDSESKEHSPLEHPTDQTQEMTDIELETSSSSTHGQEVVFPHPKQEMTSPQPKQEVEIPYTEQKVDLLKQNNQAQESVTEDKDMNSSNKVKDVTSVAKALSTEDQNQNVQKRLKEISDCCLVHKSEQIILFCKSCDRPVCSHCIIDSNHSNHKFCKVSDVVSSKKLELTEILQSNGEELSRDLKNKIKGIETQKEKVVENCQEISEEISNHKAKLALEVERWCQDLQSSATGHLQTHTQCLDSQMVQLQTVISIIKMFTDSPTSLKNLDNTKLLLVLEMLHKSSDQSATSALEMEKPLVFTPGEACIHCKGRPYGHVTGLDIEVVSDSDNTEGVVVPPGNSVAKETDDESTDSDSVYEDAVSDMRYKFKDKPIDRIAPIRNRTAFILSERKLYLIDLSKTNKWTAEPKPLMRGVVQITPMTEHGIYVQTASSTVINRVTAQGNVYRFADLGHQDWKLQLERIGIAESGNVISCTEKSVLRDYRVNITYFHEYNKDGVLVKCIDSKQYSEFSKKIQSCDIVKTKLAVFYLDAPFSSSKPNIKDIGCVVNLLKQTRYYGAIGYKPAHQFYPRGMCQDEADHLIVSDYWNHAVHQLTPEGQFRKFLMREEDGLTHPIAVAMDTDNCLWIGQQDGTIHIINYSMSHKCIGDGDSWMKLTNIRCNVTQMFSH
ncbi:uncharacterized protein LOC110464319 [Mizuhopecten yessoensis]|uniref:uncharacterized protein LOC110464319 n=1 Tax=Mizuhopecten yessoensis TaxID=6573 RepID=UPI000B45825F|nr:uncharacterized protein LOC110464319 [Mizuhopecten yessoensis]XP_021375147.1 uncharacterized protein LOC110464319 [Mizuhopecten yessoensis]XP_021375148.1 uncharacterized protein LOC110464319 [Mizuhopecten yessoensis]